MLPIITTPRLILRPLRRADAEAIFDYAQHEHVGIPAGWVPHQTLKDTHEYIDGVYAKRKESQPGPWSIIHQEDNRMIGTVELHSFKGYKSEIGFVLHPDYWRQTYMTEAVKAVMIVAFEHFHIVRLSYKHFLDNRASEHLRKKLHFTEEGIKRKGFRHGDGRVLDEVVSSFTDDDYADYYESEFKAFKAQCLIKYGT